MNKNLFSNFCWKKIIIFFIIFSSLTICIGFAWHSSRATRSGATASSVTSVVNQITSTMLEVSAPDIINEVQNFTVYYQISDKTVESEYKIGDSFTLFSNTDSDFSAWYLTKESNNQTLYYSYNSNGELEWRPSEDVVAYHIFYNEETISSDECTELTSGEALCFRSIYAEKFIDDSVTSKWKGFESYTCITNTSTLNHHIAYGKNYTRKDGTKVTYDTRTDSITGIRYVLVDNTRYYCVALGSYYGRVGSTHMVIMDNHVAFNCIVTDYKSVKDAVYKTVDGKKYTVYHNKNDVFPVEHQHEYIEFVIDNSVVKKGHSICKYGGVNIAFSIYDGNVKAIQ